MTTNPIVGQVLQLQGQRLTRMIDQLERIENELEVLNHRIDTLIKETHCECQ